MKTKKEYTAPELTVVSFKTERGYAASNQMTVIDHDFDMMIDNSSENWTTSDFDVSWNDNWQ